MARPLRIEYAGALYHITSRGNAKAAIFYDDSDRFLFLKLLAKVVKRFNWICHAYCLMTNHYHLLIETPEGNLSAGMRQLNGVYTQTFNRKHDRVGHLFQGRFKSILIDKDSYLLELCRYIVLNPVRSGTARHPAQYPWSSYAATIGQAPRPTFLHTDWILDNFSQIRDEARIAYQKFVADGLENPPSPWQALREQIALGSDIFVQKIKDLIEEQDLSEEIPRKQRLIGRPDLKDLFPSGSKTPRQERNQLICRAHLEYGYRLKEIAQATGLHYTSISKIIKAGEENSQFKT